MNQKALQEMYQDVDERLTKAEEDIETLTEALINATHLLGTIIKTENLNPIEVWRECRNALARVNVL